MLPITLVVSPGRCGTVFLYELFRSILSEDGFFFHESLHPGIAKPANFFRAYERPVQSEMLAMRPISEWIDHLINLSRTKAVVEFGWPLMSMVPLLYRLLPEQLRVIVLHRHPLQSAASHAIKGHYTINKNPAWAITPFHPRVFHTQFGEGWSSMTPYEKELFRWFQVTQYGLELPSRFPDIPLLTTGCADLFRDQEAIANIMRFCGFEVSNFCLPATKINALSDYNLETMPIRDEWKKTFRYHEVIDLGETLGYDMSEANLYQLASRYQFPPGPGPRLRRLTGYWALRKGLGRLITKPG